MSSEKPMLPLPAGPRVLPRPHSCPRPHSSGTQGAHLGNTLLDTLGTGGSGCVAGPPKHRQAGPTENPGQGQAPGLPVARSPPRPPSSTSAPPPPPPQRKACGRALVPPGTPALAGTPLSWPLPCRSQCGGWRGGAAEETWPRPRFSGRVAASSLGRPLGPLRVPRGEACLSPPEAASAEMCMGRGALCQVSRPSQGGVTGSGSDGCRLGSQSPGDRLQSTRPWGADGSAELHGPSGPGVPPRGSELGASTVPELPRLPCPQVAARDPRT